MEKLLGWKKRTRLEKGLAILWLLLLGGAVARVALGSWVTDDFFITLRYADSVVAGDGPVYNSGERTEGYTHFLWLCLITLGRGLGIDGVALGRFLGLPAFVGTLLLLVRISGRLFPRGGLWGFPAAALAWALHEDALLYASGGLETPAFILALLLAFEALCLSGAVRTAAWAFACATLLRPEGMLFSLVALVFLLWQKCRRRGGEFLLLWTLLVAPLFIFRLAYYGEPLPNTYYAKSGGGAYWQQGLHYLTAYFGSYFALGFAFLAAAPILRDLRRSESRFGRRADAALLFALAASLASIVYVTRIGGDYMFGRFLLPITPFLLLLCESLPQRLRRCSWSGVGALLLVALVWSGAFVKHRLVRPDRPWHGITDEPRIHTQGRLQRARGIGEAFRPCFENTRARFLVLAGQATLAYFAHFPEAIECYGLVDAHIARQKLRLRGRPGHEKFIDPEYAYRQRRVHFRVHGDPVRSLPLFTQLLVPGPGPRGRVQAEILIYDRELMAELRTCPRIAFVDFPRWLQESYLPQVPMLPQRRLLQDYHHFMRFYFEHDPDPEGLFAKLRAALAARGLEQIPPEPLPPIVDPGVGWR
ncbi:MAG: hypothetical protein JSW67_12815 [Candidatus Latescibacterota bacterium]|nr:MAG: hypothetical protein JSW67_12815 [Candidatus Latescibacterota bacterium]